MRCEALIRPDDKAGLEIVYIRYNFMTGIHVLFRRSGCTLEKHNEKGEWITKTKSFCHGSKLGHLEELTNLYLRFGY